MAISNEFKKHLFTTLIGAGLIGGTVFGVTTLSSLESTGVAKNHVENIRNRIVNSDTHQTLVREQEEAILNAYKRGIINAEEFTEQMREVHSEAYAYNNRYKVTDEKTAIEWEKAESKKNLEEKKLIGNAIAGGLSFSVLGLAAMGKGHLLMSESENDKLRKRDDVAEDEHYQGA